MPTRSASASSTRRSQTEHSLVLLSKLWLFLLPPINIESMSSFPAIFSDSQEPVLCIFQQHQGRLKSWNLCIEWPRVAGPLPQSLSLVVPCRSGA